MTGFFATMKARPLPLKALLMLIYGLLSFALIWLIGQQMLDNFLLFRVFEFFWFVHIVVIANQLSYSSADLLALALLGLSPGLVSNVIGLLYL